jgi:hypothetical protein
MKELIWLRTGTSPGLRVNVMIFGILKVGDICCVAEQLIAFQEELCCVKCVTC